MSERPIIESGSKFQSLPRPTKQGCIDCDHPDMMSENGIDGL